jgi:hypothetical protein
VAERRTDEGAVEGHLRHARRKVVPVLALVLRDPRRENLLEPGERARSQHLRAQRIGLQLLEVCLHCVSVGFVSTRQRTYREVAIGPAACRKLLSKFVRKTLVLPAFERGAAGLGDLGGDRLLLELDVGHDCVGLDGKRLGVAVVVVFTKSWGQRS